MQEVLQLGFCKHILIFFQTANCRNSLNAIRNKDCANPLITSLYRTFATSTSFLSSVFAVYWQV